MAAKTETPEATNAPADDAPADAPADDAPADAPTDEEWTHVQNSWTTGNRGPKPETGKYKGFHSALFYVANAKQAADWYCMRFGFKKFAFKGLETGCREYTAIACKQGDGPLIFVFEASLNPAGSNPRSDFVCVHGDAVSDILFTVEDCEGIFARAKTAGARIVEEPKIIKDEFGSMRVAIIGTYGDVVHTLVENIDYTGPYMPGYKAFDEKDPLADNLPACGFDVIDHVVGNQPNLQMTPIADMYRKMFSFHRFWSADENTIHTEYSALRSIVVTNYDETIKMPINEPAPGKRKSQIQEFVDFHGGPGVQHIAFLTKDIIKSMTALQARGVEALDIPDNYYDNLRKRLAATPSVNVKEDLDAIQKLGILVDFDHAGYLLQCFTKPLQDRPTLFIEIIQREGGHQGFGVGNFKALYETIEIAQEKRGNLTENSDAENKATFATIELGDQKSNEKDKYDWAEWDNLSYIAGMQQEGNSEAIKGAVPNMFTPKQAPFGLYAEQLNGTSFTVPRAGNRRTWMYRIMPAAKQGPTVPIKKPANLCSNFASFDVDAERTRTNPLPLCDDTNPMTFVEGLYTTCGAGSAEAHGGIAIHWYRCNKSMTNEAFMNHDGDMLIIPQKGSLYITTEMGRMKVDPNQICVVQRNIRFSVAVRESCRGYICEVYGSHFGLPELGVLGANGLAQPRHFQTVSAWYEDREVKGGFSVISKFCGELFTAEKTHSCFDVVGWSGNYAPYKYDLKNFVVINSVSIEHLDPCTFCVLSATADGAGTAACDFVIFPPRWCVQSDTFRPPYYHRNLMTEVMGNIRGKYEAKKEAFLPGALSWHHNGSAHGPDVECYDDAVDPSKHLEPEQIGEENMAFMFETIFTLRMNPALKDDGLVQENYHKIWNGLKRNFKAPQD